MSELERDVRSLLAETRELLVAAEAGALDRVAELIEARSKTLHGIARETEAGVPDEIRGLLGEVRALDQSVRAALERARETVRIALLEARDQRRAVATLHRRDRGEPRFVSRRA